MGLFDKKKKQKEQEELERIAAPYRAKTLTQLTASVERMNFSMNQKEGRILIKEYLVKLFTTPEINGGFGMSVATVEPYLTQLTEFFWENMFVGSHTGFEKILFTPYKCKDRFGIEVVDNWPIEFVRHYIKHGYPYENRYGNKENETSTILPKILECIFRYKKEQGAFFIYSFDMEELEDDNCLLYDQWLYEPGMDPIDMCCRIVALMTVEDEEMLTQYGLYRKKEGVQTDEFITFDDIKLENDKRNLKLKDFLNGCQTEQVMKPIWDICVNIAIYNGAID